MEKIDAMQVDVIACTPVPSNLEAIISKLLLMLRDCLRPYIESQIVRALGPEMVSSFMPEPACSNIQLLAFVDKKWISIFSDSSIASLRPNMHMLQSLLRSVQTDHTSDGILVPSLSTAKGLAQGVESLLMVISPAQAAHAADLGRAIPFVVSRSLPSRPISSCEGRSSLMEKQTAVQSLQKDLLLPVVLDGSNIAWRHGNSQHFSLRGSLLAMEYYRKNGHAVVLFLPEARLQPHCRDSDHHSFDEIDRLRGTDSLVLVPSTDYDDAYTCTYGRENGAVIISNDVFRDVVYQASALGYNAAAEWETWLNACRISFTFRRDEYLPNPSFNWSKAWAISRKLILKKHV